MSYPKVWGKGSDTARIVGEARLRGLDMVGLPHLKASGPGFVASKLGATSEVHIEGGDEQQELLPYVLTQHSFAGDNITWIINLVGGEHRRAYPAQWGRVDGQVFIDSVTRLVHAGGGYFASTGIYLPPGSAHTGEPHYVYGFAAPLDGGIKNASELDEDRFGKAVAFNAHAHYLDPGLPQSDPNYDPDHWNASTIGLNLVAGLEIFASGYDATVDAYWLGWGLWMGELHNKFTSPNASQTIRVFKREPYFYRTHTKQLQLQDMPRVYFPNQLNLNSQIFSMGPGKLGYLVLARDFFPTNVTWSEPTPGSFVPDYTLGTQSGVFLAYSANHGASWSALPVNLIGDRLFQHKNTTFLEHVNRGYRNPAVEDDAMRYAGIYYIGQGKSLIVVQKCLEDQASVMDQDSGAYDNSLLRTMAFMFDSQTLGLTRVNWPPDSWVPGSDPLIVPYSGNVFIRAFGEGCLALPMLSTAGGGLMVTRDFGATWEQIDLAGKINSEASLEFVTVRPYISDSRPGEVLFLYPSNGTPEDPRKGVHAYRTDGKFATFKYVGRFARAHEDETVLTNKPYGRSGVYVGENKRRRVGEVEYPPYVNPAFPGEFDK